MRRVIEFFKSNIWPIPCALVFMTVLSGQWLLMLDGTFTGIKLTEKWPWLYATGADGAREMLSTIASSVITVAGVAFSITIVVLSMTSSQYSPRVLRNFMGDWRSQVVLGGFLSIFAYCLIVLRTIEDNDNGVPYLAVFGSVVLAFVAIFLLIYFIHHVATSIRASNIIRSVFDDACEAIDSLLVCKDSGESKNTVPPDTSNFYPLNSESTGYLESINSEAILKISKMENIKIRVHRNVGEFITEGCALLSTSESLSEPITASLLKALKIGSTRTMEQDIGFGLSQLVDVALKGLSPGINDVTTSLIAIDYLGALLSKLVNKNLNPFHTDEVDPNVFFKTSSFSDYLDICFDQIRQNGMRNPAVLSRILSAIESLLERANDPGRTSDIVRHIRRILDIVSDATPRRDYEDIEIKARILASR